MYRQMGTSRNGSIGYVNEEVVNLLMEFCLIPVGETSQGKSTKPDEIKGLSKRMRTEMEGQGQTSLERCFMLAIDMSFIGQFWPK
jgi:hypothetical protein